MSAPGRIKIPACALVGVIASIDELRLATRMRTLPDLFEVVTRAENLRDLLTLFEFLWSELAAMRLCVMATGKFGPISRLFFRDAGSSLIYAPLRHPLHRGQLTFQEVRGQHDF